MWLVSLCLIGAGRNIATGARPIGMMELPLPVHQLVGVGTKIVPLRLQQICGQGGRAIAIVEAQGRGQSGHRYAPEEGIGHHLTPRALALLNGALEEVVEQQIRERRLAGVRILDVAQKDAAYDAAAAPHQCDAAIVETPVVLLGCLAHQHEALGIADDLRAVERVLDAIQVFLDVRHAGLAAGSFQHATGRNALILQSGEAAREDGLADQCDGHAVLQRRYRCPFARALLASCVAYAIQQISLAVLEVQYIPCDLDEE